MEVKLFEVRDAATFIPVLAVRFSAGRKGAERYLSGRAGFAAHKSYIFLARLNSFNLDSLNATYDPYVWGNRKMQVAHLYMNEKWDQLSTGDVIDVQFILGETSVPKESERHTRAEG